jgi:hypothetical protein
MSTFWFIMMLTISTYINDMTFISGTRLHLRTPLLYPLTFWHSFFSAKQASGAESFLGGKLLLDDYGALWTLTAWESPASMGRYRNSGAHKKAMPLLLRMCDEASTVHWQQETRELPDWETVKNRMETEGRFVNLPHPSERHQQKIIPIPTIKSIFSERKITPKTRQLA